MIDCSHGNSHKDHRRQADVAASIAEQVAAGSWQIFGAMLESHLVEGRQDYVPGQPAGLRAEHHRRVPLARADRAAARAARQGAADARIDRARLASPARPMADSRDPGVPAIAGAAIAPPIEPMLAKLAEAPARTGDFLFEPKWDGFRAIVFRGDARRLHPEPRPAAARSLLPRAARRAARARCPSGCVVDGEIVIATPHGLDFDALQLRLHPAASRVAKLAQETPASFVAFDLLAADGARPARRRRSASGARCSSGCSRGVDAAGPPHADDARPRASRREWLDALRGRRPRRRDRQAEPRTYQPGKRAMIKVKHARTADCVVAGFRWHKSGEGRWSARCCSASTTTRACCSTSA